MRVLHLIDSLRLGGKERQSVELLKGLSQGGRHEVLAVSMESEEFYLAEMRDLPIPLKILVRRMRWDPFVFVRLHKIIKDFGPDIIHTNGMLTSFYAVPLAKLLNIRIVNGSIRNAFSRGGIKWHLERLLLKFSDFRVANSRAGLASRGFTQSSRRNFVIYNGFDFSRLQGANNPKTVKSSLGIDGKHVIGMVAEFSDYKDYETYISSAKKVLNMKDGVVFLAIGDGRNMAACRNMANEHRDGILFLGLRKDVEELVSTFDVGVLSTFAEGISNSVMEYMALEKPVIVTHGGGSKEIVIDGKTGFLVPPREPDILAEKIMFLLDNPQLAIRMGKAGRKHLEAMCSFRRMTEEYLRLYQLRVGY